MASGWGREQLRPRDAGHGGGWESWKSWKTAQSNLWDLLLWQIPLRRGGRQCFFCVFCISQAVAPLADKGTAEKTEAKLVTDGFVGAALIIIINFIY